jgi:hypothetical protein
MRRDASHSAPHVAPPSDLGVLRGDLGSLQSHSESDVDTEATPRKVCRLLRSPSQADALDTGLAVEDEDVDPMGPAS